jgi:hypothetical protein
MYFFLFILFHIAFYNNCPTQQHQQQQQQQQQLRRGWIKRVKHCKAANQNLLSASCPIKLIVIFSNQRVFFAADNDRKKSFNRYFYDLNISVTFYLKI